MFLRLVGCVFVVGKNAAGISLTKRCSEIYDVYTWDALLAAGYIHACVLHRSHQMPEKETRITHQTAQFSAR